MKDQLRPVNLRQTPYNVTDQYPHEVQQGRRDLISVMMQARKDGKRASLVRDKLFINNRELCSTAKHQLGQVGKV